MIIGMLKDTYLQYKENIAGGTPYTLAEEEQEILRKAIGHDIVFVYHEHTRPMRDHLYVMNNIFLSFKLMYRKHLLYYGETPKDGTWKNTALKETKFESRILSFSNSVSINLYEVMKEQSNLSTWLFHQSEDGIPSDVHNRHQDAGWIFVIAQCVAISLAQEITYLDLKKKVEVIISDPRRELPVNTNNDIMRVHIGVNPNPNQHYYIYKQVGGIVHSFPIEYIEKDTKKTVELPSIFMKSSILDTAGIGIDTGLPLPGDKKFVLLKTDGTKNIVLNVYPYFPSETLTEKYFHATRQCLHYGTSRFKSFPPKIITRSVIDTNKIEELERKARNNFDSAKKRFNEFMQLRTIAEEAEKDAKALKVKIGEGTIKERVQLINWIHKHPRIESCSITDEYVDITVKPIILKPEACWNIPLEKVEKLPPVFQYDRFLGRMSIRYYEKTGKLLFRNHSATYNLYTPDCHAVHAWNRDNYCLGYLSTAIDMYQTNKDVISLITSLLLFFEQANHGDTAGRHYTRLPIVKEGSILLPEEWRISGKEEDIHLNLNNIVCDTGMKTLHTMVNINDFPQKITFTDEDPCCLYGIYTDAGYLERNDDGDDTNYLECHDNSDEQRCIECSDDECTFWNLDVYVAGRCYQEDAVIPKIENGEIDIPEEQTLCYIKDCASELTNCLVCHNFDICGMSAIPIIKHIEVILGNRGDGLPLSSNVILLPADNEKQIELVIKRITEIFEGKLSLDFLNEEIYHYFMSATFIISSLGLIVKEIAIAEHGLHIGMYLEKVTDELEKIGLFVSSLLITSFRIWVLKDMMTPTAEHMLKAWRDGYEIDFDVIKEIIITRMHETLNKVMNILLNIYPGKKKQIVQRVGKHLVFRLMRDNNSHQSTAWQQAIVAKGTSVKTIKEEVSNNLVPNFVSESQIAQLVINRITYMLDEQQEVKSPSEEEGENNG